MSGSLSGSGRLVEHAAHQREKDRQQLRAARLLDPEFDSKESKVETQRGFRSQPSDEDFQRVLERSAQEEAQRVALEEERDLARVLALSAGDAKTCDDDDITQALRTSLQDAPFLDDDPDTWEAAMRASCMDLGPRGVSQVAKVLATANQSVSKQQAWEGSTNHSGNDGGRALNHGEEIASQLSKMAQTGRATTSKTSQVAETSPAMGSYSLASTADSSPPASAMNAVVASDMSSRTQISEVASRPQSATASNAKRCSTPRANATLPRSAHRLLGAAKPAATSGASSITPGLITPISTVGTPSATAVDKTAGRIRSSLTPRHTPRSTLGRINVVTPSRPSVRR